VKRNLVGRVAAQLSLVASLVLAALGIHRANAALEARMVDLRDPGRVGALPDGRTLRVLSLGFERLVADLFWLRTVYYIGDEEVHAAGYPDAERLAELVTDIDPKFKSAYVLMNSVLTVLKPSPDAAIQLLEKGIEHNPRSWKLHFLQGFTLFYDKHDYERAAEHIEKAYRLGGPTYLQLLATRLYAEAGSAETAMAFVRARLRETGNPQVKRRLERRYVSLWVTRDLARIDRAIEAYRASGAGEPPDVNALVREGLLDAEPRDPEGNRYRIRDGVAEAEVEFEALEVHRVGGSS
jgi:tetratricopeptide (TPR) repeat protein